MPSQVTAAERAELDQMLGELHRHGYTDLAEYTYLRSGRKLRVGSRVRHRGGHGRGHVVALTHKPGSGWSQSWGMPDVEVIVLRDEELFGSRLALLAHYRVEVIEEG